MILQIFKPPADEELLSVCKLGDINDAISLEFEALFCGAGTATITIPITSFFAEVVEVGSLIYSAEDDMCWIVKNIKEESTVITLSCYDLNGLLYDRITMPAEEPVAGTEGKDAISGTTEYCVKHYVDYNLINSPVVERNYPRLAVADNQDRGLAADSYLASYSCVDDVVRELCEGAELGYKISFVPTTSSTQPVFVFDVIERVDRSADQSENSRVIFSVGMKNITNIEREFGVTASKNAIWCETGGIDGFINADDSAIPASWGRREEYISLSVVDEYSSEEITLAARKEIMDKFAITDSLTVEAGNPLDYRAVYNLGDIVTVYNKERDLQLNSIISGVRIKRTSSQYSVSITLGQSKPKLLDGYAKASDLLSRTQRDFPAATAGTWENMRIKTPTSYPDTGWEIASAIGVPRVYANEDELGIVSGDAYLLMKEKYIYLYGYNQYVQLGEGKIWLSSNDAYEIDISTFGTNNRIRLNSDGISLIGGNWNKFSVTNSEISIETNGGVKLKATSDGLYINNKKVLTE